MFEEHQMPHTYTELILQSVCTLKFQAYSHGNFYQYSATIQDGEGIRKRASAVKQRSKSSGLTHAQQTLSHLSQSLNGTKSKVVDASRQSTLLRYCTRGLFRQLQHWLHCVKANQRRKWREQSCRTHTMHKWQWSDGGGECGALEILKAHFGIQAYEKLSHTYIDVTKRHISNFVWVSKSDLWKNTMLNGRITKKSA